uniref:Uncharacterized protein n=1 Tax=Arundo donax TaxID=35708 RepID=A0A0A8ZC62_ARUDO
MWINDLMTNRKNDLVNNFFLGAMVVQELQLDVSRHNIFYFVCFE